MYATRSGSLDPPRCTFATHETNCALGFIRGGCVRVSPASVWPACQRHWSAVEKKLQRCNICAPCRARQSFRELVDSSRAQICAQESPRHFLKFLTGTPPTIRTFSPVTALIAHFGIAATPRIHGSKRKSRGSTVIATSQPNGNGGIMLRCTCCIKVAQARADDKGRAQTFVPGLHGDRPDKVRRNIKLSPRILYREKQVFATMRQEPH